MTLPLAVLLSQDVPPVGGIPFEGPGGVAFKTLGRPAIGLDLRHFYLPKFQHILHFWVSKIGKASMPISPVPEK